MGTLVSPDRQTRSKRTSRKTRSNAAEPFGFLWGRHSHRLRGNLVRRDRRSPLRTARSEGWPQIGAGGVLVFSFRRPDRVDRLIQPNDRGPEERFETIIFKRARDLPAIRVCVHDEEDEEGIHTQPPFAGA